MDMKSISQKLQDDIRAIMEAGLHPNQQKIDVHEPEKDEITAHDFKKLRAMKKSKPMKEDPDWVIIEQDEDNTTAKVAGHKVTLHRSLSKPGMSDTYTLHHPSGDKKVTISYDTHGDGEEVHGDKVNKAFGLDSKHKLGHKIAGSMSGMGGISKFEESVEQTNEEEKKKVVSPFDYKNYKSQIPKKPGELTGHDSKKTSTGTVYTKRPVKEEAEQIDELSKTTLGSYAKKATRDAVITRKIGADFEHQGKRAKSPGSKAASDELSQKYKSKSWQRRDGVDKAVDRLTKEETEQGVAEADELRARGGLAAINKKPRLGQTDLRNIPAGNLPGSRNKFTDKDREEHPANLKAKIKATLGKHTRPNLPKQGVAEEIEQKEYTFADYLEAARAQYVDEDAVLVANEAFKNQDITLFIDQSQSPEA
jgi:hypothetical protein